MESYLLSLRADDALIACVLGFTLGLPSLTAIFALGLGRLVSPRVEG